MIIGGKYDCVVFFGSQMTKNNNDQQIVINYIKLTSDEHRNIYMLTRANPGHLIGNVITPSRDSTMKAKHFPSYVWGNVNIENNTSAQEHFVKY